ncbi:pilus assembly FimT family protein [Sulfuriflexus mobilis]|uniref:pilus assembly FimT family protein n=1 Tax=Sulfuriflexus mobilis TaxID=1811807 RepID=UPI000F84263E|nr:prepilin-type N-terminal cleavage/methylation domain-containing protein [Sulfuriflexus mobilis]
MLHQRGFTLIELVLVMIIAGLLAATALPRFFNQDSFENRGFYTEVLNAVRYAQQLAVAINCNTQVAIVDNTYTVTIDDEPDKPNDACPGDSLTTAAPNPVTGQPGFTGSNPDVSITAATIIFDALGAADIGIDITVGDVDGYTFRVHQATGYIEELP